MTSVRSSESEIRAPLRVGVVVVAAGRGLRASTANDGPKQYRQLGGRSVLDRAVTPFADQEDVEAIVVVVGADDLERARVALPDIPKLRLAVGGATRQQSARSGLEALAADALDAVLIHDAARPLIDEATIRRVIDAIEPGLAVLPSVAVSDTLKRASADGFVESTVDRTNVFAAQTPQGFDYATIRQAHTRAAEADRHDFTDDTAVVEWCGYRTKLVAGSPDNLKLTYAADFEKAETLLEKGSRMIDVRTGNGYDVHQLVPGDHVMLCGVRIAHDQSLSGHSDADVGLHALTDALLATCGAGDIGTHFPPGDQRWRGASSDLFVRHAVEIVRRAGGSICNVDVTLIAEAPRILPHRDAMRDAMAEMTGLDRARVSVKATTNETIGFVGRREGIAAIATTSVSYGPSR